MERWAIYIDIQGFSTLWEKEDQVLWSLGELMLAIARIGRRCYPNSPDRLFVHQVGDGFLVMSDFGEESLERAATIAVALLRHVAASGRFAKAAIVEGQMSDIKNCYPKEVLDCLESELTVSLNMGLMTIFPVMGTALIRGAGLEKASPRGPLLTTSSVNRARIPNSFWTTPVDEKEIVSIDWVHFESDLLAWLQREANLNAPSAVQLESSLQRYCTNHRPPPEWVSNVLHYLRVTATAHHV